MRKIHYSWFVCLGCAMVLFCTSGLSINAFTVYQPYILQQNGFSNTQSSMLIMIRNLMSFVSMFATGRYYRYFGCRRGLALAGFLSALAFLFLGLSRTYFAYGLSFALMGIAYGLGTMIPITILLNRWFIGRSTVAISICSSVTGLSTLGIPSLLTRVIESAGLSFAFFSEALLTALVVLIAILLIRNSPEECGNAAYKPDGSHTAVEKHVCRIERTITGRDWMILIPMLLALGAMTSVAYSHLSVFMMADGFSADFIAITIMISGIALTCGKLIYGFVVARTSVYTGNRIFGCTAILGLTLCVLNCGSTIMMCAGILLYSCGLAFTTVGLAAWCGELCSGCQYETAVRRFQIGYAAGSLLFSSLPGVLADRFNGTYHPVFVFFIFCTIFVLVSIQHMLKKSKRKQTEAGETVRVNNRLLSRAFTTGRG